MTLRRNSENFQAIRAKFEGSKQKPSSKATMRAVKESISQSKTLHETDNERMAERLKGPRAELRPSSGRIKGLSSIASFSSMNAFSSNSFLRRKNTDAVGSDEMTANVTTSSYRVTESTVPYTNRNSSDLSRPTMSCTSFGASLGMTPKSTKARPIPRFNTTGNLSFQPRSTSTSESSPASASNVLLRNKQHLHNSHSSNTLVLPTRSRIPTPIRASPREDTLSTREPGIATYTYSWTHDASVSTKACNKQTHSFNTAFPEIDVNTIKKQSQHVSQSPTTTPAPIPLVRSDTQIPVAKVRQIQRRPVPHTAQAMVSSNEQMALPPRSIAGPLQTVALQRTGNTRSSRPSLPLKVRSSQAMSERLLYQTNVSRAASGGITHFNSKVVNLETENFDSGKRNTSKGINLSRQEALYEIEEPKRQFHLIDEAKSTSYWCGRLMAIQDHLKSEKHLSRVNMSLTTHHLSTSSSVTGGTEVEDALESAFDQLRSLCTNVTAQESLAIFQQRHSAYQNPALAKRRFHGALRYGSGNSNITLDALSADLAGPSLLSRLKMKKGNV